MFEVRLPSWAAPVTVDSIYADRTYAAWLEGVPKAKDNERIIAQTRDEVVRRNWGENRPVHVIPPRVKYREIERGRAKSAAEDKSHPQLPPVRVVAWLWSGTTVVHDGDGHGSHVFAIWFQEDGDLSRGAVEKALADLDWKTAAEDFLV